MKKNTLFFVLYFFCTLCCAQEISGDSLFRVEALMERAVELSSSDPQEALRLLRGAEKLTEDREQLRDIKKEMSRIYYHLDEPDSAIVQMCVWKALYDTSELTAMAHINNLLGLSWQRLEVTDSALYYFGEAYKYFKRLGDLKGSVFLLNNIGISLAHAGKEEEALQAFEQAFEFCLDLPFKEDFASVFVNYAIALLNAGRIDKAREIYEQYFPKGEQTEGYSLDLKTSVASFEAIYLRETGHLEEAVKKYRWLIDSLLQEDSRVPVRFYYGLGLTYYLQGEYDKALSVYSSSMDESPRPYERGLLLEGLSRTYIRLGEADSAIHYLDLWLEQKTAEQEESRQRLLNEMKGKTERLLQQTRIALLEQKQRNYRLLLLSSLLGMLCLAFLTVWLYQRSKIRQLRQAEKIREQKQKLLELSLRMQQKGELLKKLKDDMVELEEQLPGLSLPLRKKVEKTYRDVLNLDEDWRLFDIYLGDMHKGFYDVLKKQCPELTDNDLRMCSLVRMRFSNKEISQLLFVSLDTVKSQRYRIRKKLGLNREENLADFLSGLSDR